MTQSPPSKAFTVLVSPEVKHAYEQLLRVQGVTASARLRHFIEGQLNKAGTMPVGEAGAGAGTLEDGAPDASSGSLVTIAVLVSPEVKAAFERRMRSVGATSSAYLRKTVMELLAKVGELPGLDGTRMVLAGGPRPRVRVGEREPRGGQRVEIMLPASEAAQVDRDRSVLRLSRPGWVARAVRTVLLGRPQLSAVELAPIVELGRTLVGWRNALDGLRVRDGAGRSAGTVSIDPAQMAQIVGRLDEAAAVIGQVIDEHDRKWAIR